jgi:putative copper resistance protein D
VIEAGLIAARFIHYLALALSFGSLTYVGFAAADERMSRRFRALAIGSTLMVLLASVGVLALTIANLGGSIEAVGDGSLWSAVIEETDFGRIWPVRIGIAGLAAILLALWRVLPVRIAGIVLVGASVVLVAWTGHAAIEEGAAGHIHRWADAVHVVAAMVWIGALIPLLWLVAAPGTAREAGRRLSQFHGVGLGAVLALVASGVVNSYFLVGHPSLLWTTPYGRLLLLKLSLFGCMLILAAANRYRHAPALNRALLTDTDVTPALASFRQSISGELALAVLIIGIVAALGVIAPAASA